MQDRSAPSGRYTHVVSPLIRGNGRPQCITFRYYRMGAACNMGDLRIYLTYPNGLNTKQIQHITGCNWGPHWRTVRWEVRETGDYNMYFRIHTTGDWGNQAFDDIRVVDNTCKVTLHIDSLTGSKFTFLDPTMQLMVVIYLLIRTMAWLAR